MVFIGNVEALGLEVLVQDPGRADRRIGVSVKNLEQSTALGSILDFFLERDITKVSCN